MRTARLLKRNVTYYWRTNLAVVFGVAMAVAVLAGALLVGDSVRASLRDLFLQRLGKTDQVISATEFFREQLAGEIQSHKEFAAGGFHATCPLIELEGSVSHQTSGRRATAVRVYGVDERFWKFHGQDENQAPQNREVFMSDSLALELGARSGDALLLRIEKPSAIPVESLHGRKEDLGRTLRLTMSAALAADALGEFSVQPQQSPVRAVFVSLKLLQKELGQEGKVNTTLISESPNAGRQSGAPDEAARSSSLEKITKETATLEDYGVRLRSLPQQQSIALERSSTLIDDPLAETGRTVANSLSLRTAAVLSYLGNSISSGGRSIPYSLVTALDDESFEELRRGDAETGRRGATTTQTLPKGETKDIPVSPRPRVSASEPTSIILNEWAARDLGVHPGDSISLEYYVWREDGRLETKTAEFRLLAVVPIAGLAADRNLVPEYPGISASPSLSDWDPPFPVDLKRIRKQDEDYWHEYRTTPKAFIPLTKGQELWHSRFGKLTSMRLSSAGESSLDRTLAGYSQGLQAALEPARRGFRFVAARQQGLEASRGATDFGQYFLYFSFFLVVSALLLSALFFKLGIEQRLREIGTLQAVGFAAPRIRALFVTEGVLLAVIGSLLGVVGAVLYGYLIVMGLRTWWVGAVGTTLLTLHVSTLSLLLGGAGGILAAVICIVWTLRRLGRASTRSLLTGTMIRDTETRRHGDTEKGRRDEDSPRLPVRASPRLLTVLRSALVLTLLGALLLLAASIHLIGQVAGFFGGGTLLLVALLCFQSAWLSRPRTKSIQGMGWWPISRLGFRNATHRAGRSVLCIALIASATFIIVSVDAFRRNDKNLKSDRKSGSGGYPLLAESLLPLVHDPNTAAGREALNLAGDAGSASLANTTFTRFRLRPGDDASCLNLYQPRNPRIMAAPDDFIKSNRFAFQNSQAATKEEAENPWLLLNRELDGAVIPVIADANSMTYVLHLKVGDELVLNRNEGPIRLRLVGALTDSVFQSELLMSEKDFLRLFPSEQGYRFFLIDAPEGDLSKVTATLEDRLADFGFDVVPTSERLANFHRVENTYLSTFQMLGGLGLVLGTLGMAAVLLRNVFERRRELALLRAVGYNSSHLGLMVIAENALLLFCGLATGVVCALLAIAPVFFARGGRLPNVSLGFLLLAVLISGLTASLVATWAALRSPLLPALRAE
jgi:putative ABC transport system permease protein